MSSAVVVLCCVVCGCCVSILYKERKRKTLNHLLKPVVLAPTNHIRPKAQKIVPPPAPINRTVVGIVLDIEANERLADPKGNRQHRPTPRTRPNVHQGGEQRAVERRAARESVRGELGPPGDDPTHLPLHFFFERSVEDVVAVGVCAERRRCKVN